MKNVEESNLFLKEMNEIACRLKSPIYDHYSQTFQKYINKINKGWRIHPDADLQILFYIYFEIASAGVRGCKQKEDDFEREQALFLWRILKKAQCPSLAKLSFHHQTPQILLPEPLSEQLEEIFSEMPDEIFKEEIKDIPSNQIAALTAAFMKKTLQQQTIDGKAPFVWAHQEKQLHQIEASTFFKELNHFATYWAKNATHRKQFLKSVVEQYQQIGLILTYDSETPIQFTQFLREHIKIFDADCFSLLSSLGVDFSLIDFKYGQQRIPNAFFLMTLFKYKYMSKKLDAVKNEIQKQNPSLSIEKILHQQDDKGAYLDHHFASQRDLESLKLLASWGVDFNVVDKQGNTPIHWMMRKYSPKYQKSFVPVLEFLTKQGACWESKNKKGENAFHKLAQQGTLDSLIQALNMGAKDLLQEPNSQNQTGLDRLQYRKDKERVIPVVEKIVLNQEIQQSQDLKCNPKKRL